MGPQGRAGGCIPGGARGREGAGQSFSLSHLVGTLGRLSRHVTAKECAVRCGFVVFSLALAMSAPAWAINKCAMPNGKVSLKAPPGRGRGEPREANPAGGRAQLPAPAVSNPAAVATVQPTAK